MPTTMRNRRPSVLYIPDAWLRLEPGQTTTVERLTPQVGLLLAVQALEVVPPTPPPTAPALNTVTVPKGEGRRGGRAAATPTPSSVKESGDDAE